MFLFQQIPILLAFLVIFLSEINFTTSFHATGLGNSFQARSLKCVRIMTVLKSADMHDISPVKAPFLPAIAKSLIFFSLFSSIPNMNGLNGIVGSNLLSIQPVQAEFRAAQKVTYFRVIPKFIVGRDYYRTEVKTAVENQQWDVLEKFFELYPSKINKNDPNQIDAYDTYVNKNIIRPLKLLTSSSAEKAISPRQQLLFAQEQEFEKAMALLEGSVKDRKGEGLFASTIKAPTGKERIEQANTAYAAGNKALDEFVKVLNEGLTLEVKKVPL